MHVGGYYDLCPLRERLVTPETVRCGTGSLGFQAKGSGSFTPQAGGDVWASPPQKEMAVPILQWSLFFLSLHLNLIEALTLLEPLPYYRECLLQSTNATTLTVLGPCICAPEAPACLALYRPGRRGRYWLPLSTRTHSNRPCAPTQAIL